MGAGLQRFWLWASLKEATVAELSRFLVLTSGVLAFAAFAAGIRLVFLINRRRPALRDRVAATLGWLPAMRRIWQGCGEAERRAVTSMKFGAVLALVFFFLGVLCGILGGA